MLVLERQKGESILIGEEIVLTVTAIGNGRVRIGVQAPPETLILREEMYDGRPMQRRPPRGGA